MVCFGLAAALMLLEVVFSALVVTAVGSSRLVGVLLSASRGMRRRDLVHGWGCRGRGVRLPADACLWASGLQRLRVGCTLCPRVLGGLVCRCRWGHVVVRLGGTWSGAWCRSRVGVLCLVACRLVLDAVRSVSCRGVLARGIRGWGRGAWHGAWLGGSVYGAGSPGVGECAPRAGVHDIAIRSCCHLGLRLCDRLRLWRVWNSAACSSGSW